MGRVFMADHKHGEMDITVQTETFDNFIAYTKWSVIALTVLAVFMAIFLT